MITGNGERRHGVRPDADPALYYAFLLGMAEAGFTRDYLLYLLLVSEAQPGAGDVVLLYGIGAGVDHRAARLGLILNMHGIADVAGWRWLFAIEGFPPSCWGAGALAATFQPAKGGMAL